MDNEKFNTERTEKELYKDLLQVLEEVDNLAFKHLKFEEKLASAENLGNKENIQNAQFQMMCMKQKSFYLHLQYSRVFNLLLQKKKNFLSN